MPLIPPQSPPCPPSHPWHLTTPERPLFSPLPPNVFQDHPKVLQNLYKNITNAPKVLKLPIKHSKSLSVHPKATSKRLSTMRTPQRVPKSTTTTPNSCPNPPSDPKMPHNHLEFMPKCFALAPVSQNHTDSSHNALKYPTATSRHPKFLYNHPKFMPECLKTTPKRPPVAQSDPKVSQNAPTITPKCFKSTLKCPKPPQNVLQYNIATSKCPKTAPKCSPAPQSHPESPRTPQNHP